MFAIESNWACVSRGKVQALYFVHNSFLVLGLQACSTVQACRVYCSRSLKTLSWCRTCCLLPTCAAWCSHSLKTQSWPPRYVIERRTIQHRKHRFYNITMHTMKYLIQSYLNVLELQSMKAIAEKCLHGRQMKCAHLNLTLRVCNEL